MELKDYVRTVLISVCDGVDEAKKSVVSSTAIAPSSIDGEIVDYLEHISFEILVSTEEIEDKQKAGDAKIYVVSLSAASDSKSTTSTYNKISFRVPVHYGAKFKKS